MRSAVYPGSFDPVTFGHLDIIERASKHFDKVIVCVMVNYKKNYLFSSEERCAMIRESVAHLENVEVDVSSSLLVDYAKSKGAQVILKGLRTVQDFEFELQMALTNKKLDSDVETFFMVTNNQYSYLSSSVVRELMEFDGDVLSMKYGRNCRQSWYRPGK